MGNQTKINVLSEDDDSTTANAAVITGPVASEGRPVDGVKAPANHKAKPTITAPASRAAARLVAISSGKPVMDVAHGGSKDAKRRTPEQPKTLMRSSVKKPSKKPRVSGKSTAKPNVTPAEFEARKVDEARLAEAQKIPQSQLIKHFSPVVVPVANHPHAVAAKASTVPDVEITPHITAPLVTPTATSDQLFNIALTEASSHELPPHKTSKRSEPSRRKLRLASSTLAVLIIVGFIAYQNVTAVTLKLASSKAGFTASLPQVQPSGFSHGNLRAQPGQVSVKFQSNSDTRSFAVTEKISNWDTQTLRENFVSNNADSTYQTVQAGERTIYIYGNKSATWVNNGVWYQINSNGALSDHQLIELATSTK